MFLVGVFSTHITYIILALVYIFGFGSYALNQKKQHTELANSDKVIMVEKKQSILHSETTYYYFADGSECEKSPIQRLKPIFYFKKYNQTKYKLFDTLEWTSYNSSLPNTTRPSPIFS